MLTRPMVRLTGAVDAMAAGNRILTNNQVVAIDGDNQNITVAAIIAGIVNRTGTTANTTDVLPSADSLVAALPDLSRGDSFMFSIRMANAHTNTLTLGTGITSTGTVGIIASNIREYMLTFLSGWFRARTDSATTTNGSAVLTNLSQTAIAALRVGAGVTGTGVPANTTILAVNQTAQTVTMSANATATADNIACSFFPRFDLLGVRTSAI